MFGPCLFLFYFNDIPDNILQLDSDDDTIMYIALEPKTNIAALQEDLHKLDKWAQIWNTEFSLKSVMSFL